MKLLVEKFRPKIATELVLSPEIKKLVFEYITKEDIPNLLLCGPAGTGKTSLAKVLTHTLPCAEIYINASDERGIDVIREKVTSFIRAGSLFPLKIVILDEADYLTPQAQASLRGLMEENEKSRFILTCNFPHKIIDPIQSRCTVLKMTSPPKDAIKSRLNKIIGEEKIELDEELLDSIIDSNYPDVRRMVGSLNRDNTGVGDYITPILDIMKSEKSNKQKYDQIRQVIADHRITDFDPLYRAFYEQAEAVGLHVPKVVVNITKHQYQANFAIDQEINFMSFIFNIIK